MSALAELLSLNDYQVSGYDDSEASNLLRLKKLGVEIQTRKSQERAKEIILGVDVVVYTDAIKETHQLYAFSKAKNKFLISRGELLNKIATAFSHTIAIGGSHGKTTCACMCAHVLKAVKVPFTAHIGGMDAELRNFYSNGKEYFLTEACEYKKNLLKLDAECAVVLNVDADHMDCYKNLSELQSVFKDFCAKADRAFVCADDQNCNNFGEYTTFGIENQFSDYRAVNLKEIGERYQFTVQEYGKDLCRVRLKARGKCNVYNALAAIAVMRSYGFDEKEIVFGLESFTAVKRRFEEIGTYCGVSFICDYAHHPKEIRSTYQTAKSICKGQLFVVFQPHTYSRTKLLMKEFVETLRGIENLIVYKTYPAREYYDESGDAKTLSENVGGCLYVENYRELKNWVKKTVKSGDALLFLGAGDIYFIAERMLTKMK